MGKLRNIAGQRFGMWIVLEKTVSDSHCARWLCKCDCGTIKSVKGVSLLHGLSTNCGCIRKAQLQGLSRRQKNPNRIEEAWKVVWHSYRQGAKRYGRNYSFDLSLEQVIKICSEPCYYCGSLPKNEAMDQKREVKIYYNGIDRINNSIGYIEDNCVASCIKCNRMKRDLELEDFYEQIIAIYERRIKNEVLCN